MTREDKDSLVEMLAKIPVTETKGSLLSAIGKLLRVIDISENSIMIPTLLKDKCEFDAYEMLTLAKILKASILGHNDLVEFYLSESSSQFPNDSLAHYQQQQQTALLNITTTSNNQNQNHNHQHHQFQPSLHNHRLNRSTSNSTNTSSSGGISGGGGSNGNGLGSGVSSHGHHHHLINHHQLTSLMSATPSSFCSESSSTRSTPMPGHHHRDHAESIDSSSNGGAGSNGLRGNHQSSQLQRLHLGSNGDPDATVRLLLQIENLKVFIPHVTAIFESIVELYKNSVDTFTYGNRK